MFSTRSVIYYSRGLAVSSQRDIHFSSAAYKSVAEKVGEVANKVNKTVGKGLADAIDKGEKATYAAKDTIASKGSKIKDKTMGTVKQTREQTRKGK